MPLFSSAHGFQINGGTFMDAARDINLVQPRGHDLEEQPVRTPMSISRQVSQMSGVRRNVGVASRMRPYDVSNRPHLLGRSRSDDSGIGSLPDPLPENVETLLSAFTPQSGSTTISGGTFIGGNVNHVRDSDTGLHILYHAAACDATHDSEDRFPPPQCHPETRTQMLEVLLNWARGPPNFQTNGAHCPTRNSAFSPLVWLHGPAGAGKSAIAQSFCRGLEAEGRLGASFFFKRGHSSRGHAKRLFTTIAYQLAVSIPDLHPLICRAASENPAIVDKSRSIQLRKLIVEPFQELSKKTALHTMVVVIDGLDECDDQNIQQEILHSSSVVEELCLPLPYFPLRFFFASRLEPHICEAFDGVLKSIHRPLNIHHSFEDVRRYLQAEFTRIHWEHHETMARVPMPWPSPTVLDYLVDKSSGYFIYASTVIQFTDDKKFRPTDRLEVLIGTRRSDSESPLSGLDQLYIQILSDSAHPQLFQILAVLGAKFRLSVLHIEQLLQLRPGDLRLLLRGLHSIVNVPERGSDNEFLPIHHASFLDFLHDQMRSGMFYVGSSERLADLARHFLQALSHNDVHGHPHTKSRHVAWQVGQTVFEYITSVEPSPDLISLLRSFNPDFLFHQAHDEHNCISRPIPEDLIQRWTDYQFMLLCGAIWSKNGTTRRRVKTSRRHTHRLREFLSQAPPALIQILFVHKIDAIVGVFRHSSHGSIFNIRRLVDLSWDDLRATLCALRETIGQDPKMLARLLDCASDPTVFQGHSESTLQKVAYSAIHHRKQLVLARSTELLLDHACPWSRFLRLCPPSSDLLQALHELESVYSDSISLGPCSILCLSDENLHNIIQWLETFPRPPLELIDRFNRHIDLGGRFERRWEEWRDGLAKYFLQTSCKHL
ncbi:hypothetical protein C8F04DRAFT_187773 [Mycena alexandri]|uniref:Nephrocystin 3-like N-terminal domain-containing protein n=1 Tax=Mycena alexandri TaxID=1745969 RepID=A0AAD6X8Y2_9AGAR|nr:hypothetical protein C8F04DRAFT_187773 [Mycena alexandri]